MTDKPTHKRTLGEGGAGQTAGDRAAARVGARGAGAEPQGEPQQHLTARQPHGNLPLSHKIYHLIFRPSVSLS